MQNPDSLITSYTHYFLRILFNRWLVWLCGWGLAWWYIGWGFKSRKWWNLHIIFISVLSNVEYSRLIHNKHEVSKFIFTYNWIYKTVHIEKKLSAWKSLELKSFGIFTYHHIRSYHWANSIVKMSSISMMLTKYCIFQ